MHVSEEVEERAFKSALRGYDKPASLRLVELYASLVSGSKEKRRVQNDFQVSAQIAADLDAAIANVAQAFEGFEVRNRLMQFF
jgi:hypothetical protein